MTNVNTIQRTLNQFKGASLGLCLLATAGTADAAFIDLSGTVNSGGDSSTEAAAPFTNGDQLNGFIEINDSAATAGSGFDVSDLLNFSVTIGPATFALPTATPFGFFDGTIADDGTTVSELNVTTGFTDFPGCGSCNLTLNGGADSFAVTLLGLNFGFAQGSDFTATVRQQASAVPEPSSLLLFGAGLLGLGLARKRKH